MLAATDSAPPATGSKAVKPRGPRKKKDAPDAPQLTTAAALDEPITRMAAAQCFLGIAGVIFGPEIVQPIANTVSKCMNLSEPELVSGTLEMVQKKRKLREASKAPAADKSGPSKRKLAANVMTPYKLFLSFAMKDLYNHKHLPVVSKFLAEHGDHGRIDFATANTFWSSLPADDKERASALLKPFLDVFNSERKQQREEGGTPGAGGEQIPAGLLWQSYLQYLEQHPEASLIRLLRLDGDAEDLGVAGAQAAARGTPAAAGAAAAAGGGPTAMDVDGADGDEEEEEEEEGTEEDEEEEAMVTVPAGGVKAEDGEEDEEEEGGDEEEGSKDEEFASAGSDSDGEGEDESEDGTKAEAQQDGTGSGDGDGDDGSEEEEEGASGGSGSSSSDDDEGASSDGGDDDVTGEATADGDGSSSEDGDGSGSGSGGGGSSEAESGSGSDDSESGSGSEDDGGEAAPAPAAPAAVAALAVASGAKRPASPTGAPAAVKRSKK